jgi:small-conductance mechanosensitive channel
MQVTSPTSPSAPPRAFAGLGTFLLGFLLPVAAVLLVRPLFLVTVSLGVATLVSTVLIPKFALAMYAIGLVLLVFGVIVAIAGLAAARLRPLPSFLLGLAFSLWTFGLYVGLWYIIAYKGAGFK